MVSVKTIAQNCLSLSGSFSITRNFFGYIFGGPTRPLSLKRQIELIQGKSLDVNVILVARENFTNADIANTTYALQFTRDAYSQVDLGIRKLNWQSISVADAGRYAVIDSDSEAHDLTDDWNGIEGALDLFVVRVFNGYYGYSAVKGPCAKDDKDRMTGSVVSLNCCSSCPAGVICADDIGTTFGHEIGHYLGENHDGTQANLMGDSHGSVTPGAMALSSSQGNTMKGHCYVHEFC